MIQQLAILSRHKILHWSNGIAAFPNKFFHRHPDSSRTANKILVSRTALHQVCSYTSVQTRGGLLNQSCSANCRNNAVELQGHHCRSSAKLLCSNPGKAILPYRCSKLSNFQKASFSNLQQRTKHSVGEQWNVVNVRGLMLSAKAIVEASPLSLQPYLRLIRLDRPIG